MKEPHKFDLTVYYEDTDAGGIVYYANYLKFAERARTDFLNQLGFSNTQLMKEDLGFVARHIEVDYNRSAFLEDKLTVETSLLRIGSASLTLRQDIKRKDELLASLTLVLVQIKVSARKPARIEGALRKAFETL